MLEILDRQVRDHWLQTGKYPKKIAVTEGQMIDIEFEAMAGYEKYFPDYGGKKKNISTTYKGIPVVVVEVI